MSQKFPNNVLRILYQERAKYTLKHIINNRHLSTFDQNNNYNNSCSSSQVDLVVHGEENKDLQLQVQPLSISSHLNVTCCKRYAGIFLTLLASFILSLVTLIAKVLSEPEYGFESYSTAFWRYAGVLIPSIPLLLHYEYGCGKSSENETGERISVFSTIWPLTDKTKLIAFFGVLSKSIIFYALHYLTLGDTAVITYSTPVIVTVLAHFFLNEKIGFIPVLLALFTFSGVIIITRPPFLTGTEIIDTNIIIGTGYATGSLLCSSINIILTRKFNAVHYSVMTAGTGLIGTIEAFILTIIFNDFHVPYGLYEIIFVTALGILSFLGQMIYILAFKVEQAGPVSLIRSCDVLFGFVFQFLFLGVKPDLMSTIGGSIVLTCVLITGLRKWVSALPIQDDRKTLPIFKFLLL